VEVKSGIEILECWRRLVIIIIVVFVERFEYEELVG